MSRSNHNKNAKCGKDWGAKYKCDKLYGGIPGKHSKKLAAKERREQSKNEIRGLNNDR